MENLYQQGLQGGDLRLCSMRIRQLACEQTLPGCEVSFQHLLAAARQHISCEQWPWMPPQPGKVGTMPNLNNCSMSPMPPAVLPHIHHETQLAHLKTSWAYGKVVQYLMGQHDPCQTAQILQPSHALRIV